MKKIITVAAAAAIGIFGGLAVETFDVSPAHADTCGGGGSPFGGGAYCDGDFWPDGSFNHCVQVYVLGFGGTSCGRVCPGNPPAPYPGPGPGGRC